MRSAASKQTLLFGLLILLQAAHSVEEYAGRLWEEFPPARIVSGLFSSDLERGFMIFNTLFDAFGYWCLLWPVRRKWPVARILMWFWVAVELVNGIGHPVWSILQGGYTPGVVTAVILLPVAILLARSLRLSRL